MGEKDIRQVGLDYLKSYYENYYNQYAARKPELVDKIKYFIDWLNTTAKVEDIEAIDTPVHIRECGISVSATKDDWDFYRNFKGVTYLIDNEDIADCVSNMYYSTEANSKVVPGKIDNIAYEYARYKLIEEDYEKGQPKGAFSDFAYMGIETKLKDFYVNDPVAQNMVVYKCHYPHPKGGLKGKTTRVLTFVVWDGRLCLLFDKGPDAENIRPNGAPGCYVATSVYGSYDCPEVWTLRRYRDEKLSQSLFGRMFIKVYYAISPTIVRLFGKTAWFNRFFRPILDRFVVKLYRAGYDCTPYDDK